MRWTDIPRDREFAGDADPPVLQRGQWDDLRQRLERLPAGHPSAPDEWPPDDEADAEENRAAAAGAAESGAEEGRAGGGGRQPAGPGGRTGPDRPAGPAGLSAGHAPGPGRREPYRPWFASGESPEPWFSADPGA